MLKVCQRYSKLVNVLPFSTFLKADEEILLSRPLHDTIYGHHLPHSLLGPATPRDTGRLLTAQFAGVVVWDACGSV